MSSQIIGMMIAANRAKLSGDFPHFAEAANVFLRDMICPGSQPPHAAESVTYRVAGSARREETTSAGAGTLFPTISSADWRAVFSNPRPNALAALIRNTLTLRDGSGVACRTSLAQTVEPTLKRTLRAGSIFPIRAEVAQGQPAASVSCPVQ